MSSARRKSIVARLSRELEHERMMRAAADAHAKLLTAVIDAMRQRLNLDRMAEIGQLIATQNNRATDQPLFIVQQKNRIYGLDDGYAHAVCWVNDDACSVVSGEEFDRLERLHRDGEDTEDWRRVGYTDTWEFVTACFTEQGCKDYIALNGHNLKEPRIYAAASFRNKEFQDVRNTLIALAQPVSSQAPAKEPPL